MAGKDWLTGFLERHPDLAKRKPQGLSQARCDGLNKIDVQNYFSLLGQLLKDLNLFNCPERIYNCDETGFPLNNTAQNHIIAKKGSKQVISKTCVEKGENVTVLACTSPVGNFIPPFVIYKGKRSPSKDVQIGFPNGTKVITTESGWITEDAFLLWLKHFDRFRAPGPSVLVLDGHISHKSLRALEFCEKKQIHVICLPSHTTHRLQPLDRSFFKPLKTYFCEASNNFVHRSFLEGEGPRKISKVTFDGILKTAWCKAATQELRRVVSEQQESTLSIPMLCKSMNIFQH